MPQRDAVTSRHLVVTHDSLTYVISLFPETPLSRWRQAPSGQSQLHALAPSLQADGCLDVSRTPCCRERVDTESDGDSLRRLPAFVLGRINEGSYFGFITG